jgi:hypothetical protein
MGATNEEDAMDEMQEPINPTNGTGEPADPAQGADTSAASSGEPQGTSQTGTPDEGFAWSSEEGAAADDAKASGEKMLGQLQGMIDSVATQATPMARQIGIKAAELAAAAADRAGPFAQKAAEATVDASAKFAERSRHWAAELRAKTVETNGSEAHNGSSSSSVAVAEPEDAPGDTPPEG